MVITTMEQFIDELIEQGLQISNEDVYVYSNCHTLFRHKEGMGSIIWQKKAPKQGLIP